MLLTRAQRVALKAVFDRQPLYKPVICAGYYGLNPEVSHNGQMSYREFRRTVVPGSGCIMVPWCGMWLGIEPDGYTHS